MANYTGLARDIIMKLKFNSDSYLYRPMAELMLESMGLNRLEDLDQLAYIPMRRFKEARRGYNQSQLLAKDLAKKLGLSLNSGLRKTRPTRAQSTLDARERRKNLKGAFSYRGPSLESQRILLVDDIVTTGSTMEAAALELKKNGAAQVIGLAFISV